MSEKLGELKSDKGVIDIQHDRSVVFKITRKNCGFKGCEFKGEFAPELVFKNLRGSNGQPLTIALEIEVCEEHRRYPKKAFLSDDGYRHIIKMIRAAGYKETPPIKDVRLQFVTELGIVIPGLN